MSMRESLHILISERLNAVGGIGIPALNDNVIKKAIGAEDACYARVPQVSSERAGGLCLSETLVRRASRQEDTVH